MQTFRFDVQTRSLETQEGNKAAEDFQRHLFDSLANPRWLPLSDCSHTQQWHELLETKDKLGAC